MRTYNMITVFFLGLTVLCCFLTLIFALGVMPVPLLGPRQVVIPQVAVLPSPTITDTPLPPTWTLTATLTFTPSSTFSVTPPPTASLTITPTPGPTDTPTATETPTVTETPSASATFTPSVTPTGPTPTFTPTLSPFPFAVQGNGPLLTANWANAAGCAWQGVGGQVLGLGGQAMTGMQVRVTGGGIGPGGGGLTVATGSNTLYGAAGWEQMVSTQTNNETYYVELLSPEGTVVSPTVQVTFPNNCAQNLAMITFVQTR